MVKNSTGLVSSNDLSAILRKEALYTAAGLVSFDLYDEVDFMYTLTIKNKSVETYYFCQKYVFFQNFCLTFPISRSILINGSLMVLQ